MDNVALVRAELDKHTTSKEERQELEAWADDACISRYLRARKNNVAQAIKLLRASLKWRVDFSVASLHAEEFPDEFAAGKMYVGGRDTQGRPVLITRKKADAIQAGQHERYLRHLVFTLESTVAAMPPGVEQWVWIMDLQGYSRANSPPLSVSYATMKILADHYPERLKTAFIVDAPSIFSFLWKALASFIDPVTKEKVKFVYSKDLRPAEAPEDASGVAREEAPATKPVEPSKPESKSVDDAFSPYASFYRTPYDEAAYRTFLTKRS
ncbi:Sec14p-like phosphatidylinositol transfer family protein [Klebsormidium nitens]|uniref:Sec14p-like phosphatidylinositol transfer family protein n=1 Tax=Klebsormidium nitens TaxID=105231 RepID=A0A1Y1HRU0_KLENI|nr:Sec14p-like phosphatidylinositol transfer family protein [Klebsormidium nitens]|eukprot:GAQ80813.1 Sec14p-like phosphatidylinositol transfer family protein [Klebsormidium nitens]